LEPAGGAGVIRTSADMVETRVCKAVPLVAVCGVPSERLGNCAVGRVDFVRNRVAPTVVDPDLSRLPIGCKQDMRVLCFGCYMEGTRLLLVVEAAKQPRSKEWLLANDNSSKGKEN
jgi:hypothetical protein